MSSQALERFDYSLFEGEINMEHLCAARSLLYQIIGKSVGWILSLPNSFYRHVIHHTFQNLCYLVILR